MNLTVRKSTMDALNKKGLSNDKIQDAIRYTHSEFVRLDVNLFSKEALKFIEDEAAKDPKLKGNGNVLRQLKTIRNIAAEGMDMIPRNLETLQETLKQVLMKTEHKFLFQYDDSGLMEPYFVKNIEYHPPRKDSPAYVRVELRYIFRRKDNSTSFSFHYSDINTTVKKMFENKRYAVETPELYAQYENDLKKYHEIYVQLGKQYLASGVAEEAESDDNDRDRWRRYSRVHLTVDGKPSNVVIDDGEAEFFKPYVTCSYWQNIEGKKVNKKVAKNEEDFEDDDEEKSEELNIYALPVHPYIRVFDLNAHNFLNVHVNDLAPYKYDKTTKDKLILPQEVKELVSMLVESTSEVMEDIIKGKSGGIIVLSTGKPGTGKTLTAEVASESLELPLYKVQSSQLGIDVDDLEKELKLVLNRATRWNALLLIDESDVYIHERGEDLVQNAVVGVFLRVLEYYKGMLFMTSNREVLIDDAIKSRATAHIRYEVPTDDDQAKIWDILAKEFKIKLGSTSKELAKAFPGISGRDVKSALKLAKFMSKKEGSKVDVKMIDRISKFLQFTGRK